MLVERRNGPMFYVTINPTVNSTAKDYKRSFNRSTGIIVCLSWLEVWRSQTMNLGRGSWQYQTVAFEVVWSHYLSGRQCRKSTSFHQFHHQHHLMATLDNAHWRKTISPGPLPCTGSYIGRACSVPWTNWIRLGTFGQGAMTSWWFMVCDLQTSSHDKHNGWRTFCSL